MRVIFAPVLALVFACSPTPRETRSDVTTSQDTGAANLSNDEIRRSAEIIVSFLYGDADSTLMSLADSVDLYVAPEGGGAHVRRSREDLFRRDMWYVRAAGRVYSFIPPGRFQNMESFIGRHVNCRPADLRIKLPGPADRPHVGVLLSNPDAGCLETWNATFIFDTASGTPLLVGALYDQWEW